MLYRPAPTLAVSPILAALALIGLSCVAAPGARAQLEPRLTLPKSTMGAPGAERAPADNADANPVVASVDGYPIHLQDLSAAMKTLPDPLQGMSFETLYPVLVDRLVDHQALVMMAKRAGLEESPRIKQEIKRATEQILEAAYLAQKTQPKVTDQAVRAAYQSQFANRPATEEVRARHILVATEDEARRIIEELREGADFAAVARAASKDPDGKNGGDVGFFRREQVWPAFGDLAFALQPGQIGSNPIRNEFGWHVVKVEERRQVASPGFADIEGALRQELLAQAVRQAVEEARSQLIIRRFNLDGSELETGPRYRSVTGPEGSAR